MIMITTSNIRATRFLAVLFCIAIIAVPTTHAGKKNNAALVVGVSYQSNADVPTLPNTINDARDVGAQIGKLSTVRRSDVLLDPTADDFADAFSRFVSTLNYDSTAIFYYAGHGIQIDHNNYIVTEDGKFFPIVDVVVVVERARRRRRR